MGHRGFRKSVRRGECKLSDFQLFLYGLYGFICNFWLVFIYIIAALIQLWRWEKREEKRMEKAIKKRDAKRVYCNTNVKEL